MKWQYKVKVKLILIILNSKLNIKVIYGMVNLVIINYLDNKFFAYYKIEVNKYTLEIIDT